MGPAPLFRTLGPASTSTCSAPPVFRTLGPSIFRHFGPPVILVFEPAPVRHCFGTALFHTSLFNDVRPEVFVPGSECRGSSNSFGSHVRKNSELESIRCMHHALGKPGSGWGNLAQESGPGWHTPNCAEMKALAKPTTAKCMAS